MSESNNVQRLLPKSFSPSVNEVMIGRGRKVANHIGNDRFQDLIHSQLYEYSKAKTKAAKSSIILRVLKQIRESSHVGGFVKQDSKTKRWYSLEDASARISTAQAFRDALSSNYRSSKQYKQQKRWKQRSPTDTSSPSDISEPAPTSAPVVVKEEECKFSTWNKDQGLKDTFSMSLAFMGKPAPVPQMQQETPRSPSMTMSGLKGILDSALDIMDDDDDLLFGDDIMGKGGAPMNPPSIEEKDNDIQFFLESFESQVECTENPFEPRPIESSRAPPAPVQSHHQQEMYFKPQNWQTSFAPSAFSQVKQGNSNNEQSFSLRDVLSFGPSTSV